MIRARSLFRSEGTFNVPTRFTTSALRFRCPAEFSLYDFGRTCGRAFLSEAELRSLRWHRVLGPIEPLRFAEARLETLASGGPTSPVFFAFQDGARELAGAINNRRDEWWVPTDLYGSLRCWTPLPVASMPVFADNTCTATIGATAYGGDCAPVLARKGATELYALGAELTHFFGQPFCVEYQSTDFSAFRFGKPIESSSTTFPLLELRGHGPGELQPAVDADDAASPVRAHLSFFNAARGEFCRVVTFEDETSRCLPSYAATGYAADEQCSVPLARWYPLAATESPWLVVHRNTEGRVSRVFASGPVYEGPVFDCLQNTTVVQNELDLFFLLGIEINRERFPLLRTRLE